MYRGHTVISTQANFQREATERWLNRVALGKYHPSRINPAERPSPTPFPKKASERRHELLVYMNYLLSIRITCRCEWLCLHYLLRRTQLKFSTYYSVHISSWRQGNTGDKASLTRPHHVIDFSIQYLHHLVLRSSELVSYKQGVNVSWTMLCMIPVCMLWSCIRSNRMSGNSVKINTSTKQGLTFNNC